MPDTQIVRQEQPDYGCLRILVDGHHAYRRAYAKHKRESFVGLAAHGDGGAIVGGLLGRIHCDALVLDVLWVAEGAREGGLGRRLMQAVHQIARDADVHVVYHELKVPQALPFFEKLNYRVAARLEGAEPERIFLYKHLGSGVDVASAVLEEAMAALEAASISKVDDASSPDLNAVHRFYYDFLRGQGQGTPEVAVPVVYFLNDEAGDFAGGLSAERIGQWLNIKYLWVHDRLRGHGWGSRLVAKVEADAKTAGLQRAVIDDANARTRPFFEKLGYAVFGEIEDFPPGHTRFFMQKTL